MSATSVGQIGLDLVVNQNQFNKQMTGIQSLAKKAGAMLASAFAVKKLVDFGQQCIELGSDLQEVQNVVDVTFPKMTAKVDKFAKSAAASFGLSETMAKKYSSLFGTMAKQFGFTEESAYDMGTTLAGLAGDVASFYNVTQDEAYTKLKAVFSGETEVLKDIGIVMTQSALDAYALSKGYDKTTKSMSEAEKVALRYAFVQDKLSAASGDFVRTSDDWANQVRILNLRFDSLKATLGQGFINILTPVIKIINTMIEKLNVLAESFKSFTELLTGNKSSDTSLATTTADANALSGSILGIGDAAEESAKKMKYLAGFDEINKLDSSTSSASNDTGLASGVAIDYGTLAQGETVLDNTNKTLLNIINNAKKLAELFKKGFATGLGNGEKKINSIRKSIKDIGKELKKIATDSKVNNALSNLWNSTTTSFGEVVGSFTSIGLTIGENITGGISDALQSDKDSIKERLIGIFSVESELSEKIGGFFTSFADVFSVFSNGDAKNITAGIVSIFTNGFLAITELALNFASDILSIIINPFIENSEEIKEVAESTLTPIATVVDTVSKGFQKSFGEMLEMYERDIKPFFKSLSDGISEIVGTISEGYNQHIAPVLKQLSQQFNEVWNGHIKPTIDKAIEFIGKIGQTLQVLWETILQPLINWLVKTIIPIVAPIIEKIGTKFMDVFSTISDVIGGIFTSCSGLLDFICGVFTGDWKKAWSGVKTFFKGIWDSLSAIIKNPINSIIKALNSLIGGLNKIKFDIPDWVPSIGGKSFGFNISKIPLLAQGGYVKANTPQLAIIGDNKHQGEIVSPEDKLQEMAVCAAQLVSGKNQYNDTYMMQILILLQKQNELLTAILEKEMGISANDIFESVRKSADSYTKRTGEPAFDY